VVKASSHFEERGVFQSDVRLGGRYFLGEKETKKKENKNSSKKGQ